MVELVPDGVARVELRFDRGYVRSVAVVDNVVALTVPRRGQDTTPRRQVWRAADGSIVNVVPAPRGR